MRKLERLIRKELKNHQGWWFLGQQKRGTHYVVTNGRHKIICASTPKQNQTVLKNLRDKIRRVELGRWDGNGRKF